ncbi:DNA-3-methyladenine glycosylase I [Erysipelothrix sp. HDW6C]|uniref:DNA-3-methyladenine glycosylase I n=1 Tax=Erysipelothrix sp. HDW6C TaxID=2714930 RepID=UPI00140D215B|nr:DNA-3-methyladenine glycosylase I [Erysipelothrix sp. HDW6C]QIK69514.1 DNA-3-methyladenine glycosylase I [Erysipelothrix sp. HDW6C]
MTKRCTWAEHSENEIAYHDSEWGVPNHDDRYLFEMLMLEGQQSGLSWSTILNKRETMRAAYANFDPYLLAEYDAEKVETLLLNPGIIRHRLKIEAIINNAKAYVNMIQDHESLDVFLWRYVDDAPIVNHYASMSDVPASSELSTQISKDLKKLGFKFVGPTTVYAFMQAVGMVDDHMDDCFKKTK